MANIKAIETVYNGYRFRSRLEARWAVFLDGIGVKYRYEIEGFDIDGEYYLPDFWLPFPFSEPHPHGTPNSQGYWLEIKPTPLDDREKRLLSGLAKLTKHHAYAFCGVPRPDEFLIYLATLQGRFVDLIDEEKKGISERAELRRSNGFPPKQQQYHLGFPLYGLLCNLRKDANGESVPIWSIPIYESLNQASQARFEYGETPRA